MKSKLTAAAVVLFSMALTVSSFGASFYDINDVPWSGAVTYINRAADLGLMVGDQDSAGNTVFRARDNVTYCEAMQLAYQIMNKTAGDTVSSATVTKWTPILSSYNIPSWAYTACSYGLENSILSTTDVSRFMKSASNNNYATREDVAVIFGKTLAQEESINSGAVLAFADSNQIASTSVPYVDLLNRLDIMVGDSSNNFNPKNNINRAEMAVVSTNTYDYLLSSGNTSTSTTTSSTFTGTITDIDGSMLVVDNGTSEMGFMGGDSVETIYDGDSISFSSLNVNDRVRITYRGSTIEEIELLSDYVEETETIEGELIELTSTDATIDEDGGSEETYYLGDDVTYRLNGSSSTRTSIQDAIDDYTVTVTIEINEDEEIVSLEAEYDDDEEEVLEGIIYSLSSSTIRIEDDDGDTYSYSLADEDDLTIRLDGSSSDLDELRDAFDEEDEIYVELDLNSDDDVDYIDASIEDSSSSGDDEDSGEITSLTSSRIEIDDDETYDLADESDIDISVDDGTYEDEITNLDDLIDAYDDNKIIEVTIYIEDDEVIEISGEVTGLEGDIVNVSVSSEQLDIETDSGEYTYEFYEDDIDVYIDGDREDADELESVVDDEGYLYAELTLEDGYVTRIEAEY